MNGIHPLYTLCCSNEFNQDFKPFLHLFGVNAGILLSHLVSKMNFYYTKDLLVDGEWFYRKRDAIEESTALTRPQQRNALAILSKIRIIDMHKKDNPAKMYYKINTSILLFVLHEYNEFKKHIENNAPEKLSEIGRKALQEYRSTETLPQDVLKHYHKMLPKLTSLIKDYIELNYKKIEFNFSFQNSQKGFLLEAPEEAPAKKQPAKFSFNESLLLFPAEFQENEDFKEQWKAWWKIKKSHFKKPISKHVAKTAAKIFKNNLSMEEVIARLKRAADPEKPYFHCYFDDDKGRTPGSIIKPKKPPTSKKPKKPLSEMTRAEQADAKEAAKEIKLITDYLDYFHVDYDPDAIDAELQRGRDYLEALYKKAGDASKKQKLGPYDIDYARIWVEHLPAMRDVIKAYIDDLVKWVNEPNAGFFKWDHKSFVQFRQKMQRQYYSYDWEKGRPIQS